jgi:hypothetical protein
MLMLLRAAKAACFPQRHTGVQALPDQKIFFASQLPARKSENSRADNNWKTALFLFAQIRGTVRWMRASVVQRRTDDSSAAVRHLQHASRRHGRLARQTH